MTCGICGKDISKDYSIEDTALKKMYCAECFEEASLEDEKLPIVNQ